MKYMIALLLMTISMVAIAQTDTQTETLKLKIGDKFSTLGLEGKLYDLYNASGGEACRKSKEGKVRSAAVAYIEFKYNKGRKVSTELCFQRISLSKEDKVGKEERHSTESYKAKDAVVSLTITKVDEEAGIVTLEISKEPLPDKKAK